MITDKLKTTSKKYMTIVHFNRIEMQRGGEYVWTVHNQLGCFQVKQVLIATWMKSIFRPKGQQPRAFFKGPAYVEVKNGVALLT